MNQTHGSSPLFLWLPMTAIWAGLLAYSQTLAFYGDEGFHLLAAQLILAGKRPYLDFFYQHVPLYAYLNAGWFWLFGNSWRSAHALSALLTGACIWLVAGFVFARVREHEWRLPAALTAALLVGLNALVIQYGTLGLPYGLCLFLSAAAFRLVIGAVRRDNGILPICAGLCAGAAAAASLLTAPVVPILFLWMLGYGRHGTRLRKAIWFLVGAVIPFLPLLWLAAQAPQQVFFDVVQFHLFYRRLSLGDTIMSDLRLITSLWFESAQGLVMLLFAGIGLLSLFENSEWDLARRAEFGLCAWLTAGLGIYVSCTLPTYPAYFVLVVPFLSVLASAGVYAIGSAISFPGRHGRVVLLLIGLFLAGLAKPAYQYGRDFEQFSHRWQSREEVGQEVNRVTPHQGEVWADEFIYFVARRLPPPGLENFYPDTVRLASASSVPIAIVPQSQQNEWLAEGRFITVVIELDDPRIEALGLRHLYAHHKRVDGYDLFWGARRVKEE